MKPLHEMSPLELAYEVDKLRRINAEMLVALEEMLTAWDSYEMTAALDIEERRKAKSAIAKARGE